MNRHDADSTIDHHTAATTAPRWSGWRRRRVSRLPLMQTEALQRAMNVLGTEHIGALNHEPYDHPEYGWKRPLSCNACARLVIEEMLYGD